ncbi:MAG: LamG domain-containing protein [Saccharofermentanales bacterium]
MSKSVFLKKTVNFILFLSMVIAVTAGYPVKTAGYLQSKEVIVATAEQLKKTGCQAIDSPMCSWTANGKRYWLQTNLGGHQKFSGPVDNPTQTPVSNKTDNQIFTNRAELKGTPWFVSIYKDTDGALLAFIHIENFDSGAIKTGGRIGLAYSTNNGDTFKYLGEIYEPEKDADGYNVQGCPYLVKDGYFYIYTNEGATVCTRGKVADVLAAAKNGTVSTWNKYYNNEFNEPGMGGKWTGMYLPGITHTQAAYSTYNKKYYMTTTSMNWSGANTYIKLWQSDDCVNWSLYQVVVNQPGYAYSLPGVGWQHTTIIDYGNLENAVVGKKFYIYCGNFGGDINRMQFSRWIIDLGDTPVNNAPLSVWKLEENANDENFINRGLLIGSALYVPGRIGQAVKLFGENSYVNVENNYTLNRMSQVTLSLWVNMLDFPTYVYNVAAKDLSYRIMIGPKGEGHFAISTDNAPWYSDGTTASFPPLLAKNKWYHLVGTYDGEYAKIYIDGQLKGTGTKKISGAISASDTYFRMGIGGERLDYFYGMIDEVKLYGKGLSSTEVLALYNKENAIKPPQSIASSQVQVSQGTSSSKPASAIASSQTANSQISGVSENSSLSESLSESGVSSQESSQISGNESQESLTSSVSSEALDSGSGKTVIYAMIAAFVIALGVAGIFLIKKMRNR